MLSAVVSKLQENCPLRHTVVRMASCLSPESIALCQEESKLRFSKLVEKFFEGKWLSENECEDTKLQYDKFLSSSAKEHKEKFVEFDRASGRVDLFFGKFLNENKDCGSLWNVCKILFTLSHGQSAVERSFSVNKDFLVENLKKESLCTQRMVYGHMQTECSTLHEFKVEKELVEVPNQLDQDIIPLWKQLKIKKKKRQDPEKEKS